MGTRTATKIATGNYNHTLLTIDVSSVKIQAATAIELSNAGYPVDAWIQIGLMSGGTTLGHRTAVLSQGYAGRMSGVAWTGHIANGRETFLYASVYAREASTYRLTCITRTPAEEKAKEPV